MNLFFYYFIFNFFYDLISASYFTKYFSSTPHVSNSISYTPDPNSNSWSRFFTKPSFLSPKNVIPSHLREQELGALVKSNSNSNINDIPESQKNQIILTPPVFKILKACIETETLERFINYIINSINESDLDSYSALTKLNDIFHCEKSNNYLQRLTDDQKIFIIQSLKKREKHLKILIEALETKIKEIPQGSTKSGRKNIIKQCKRYLYDTMIELSRGEDQYKGLTAGMCLNRSCTEDNLDRLKKLFMIKKLDKPSACSHYIIKYSVSQMIDNIKTKWNFNESPIMPYKYLMDQVMSIAGISASNLQDLIIDSNDINSKIRIFIDDCEKYLEKTDL